LIDDLALRRFLAARAQQPSGMRRIGVLMDLAKNDPEGEARIAAFLQGLAQLGWTDGRNVQIDTRWGAGDADRIRRQAAELSSAARRRRGRSRRARSSRCGASVCSTASIPAAQFTHFCMRLWAAS